MLVLLLGCSSEAPALCSDPLRLEGDVLVAEQGKEVGVVGSVSVSPELGGAIALAVVKRHFAEAGTALTTAGGTQAVVAMLPFGLEE